MSSNGQQVTALRFDVNAGYRRGRASAKRTLPSLRLPTQDGSSECPLTGYLMPSRRRIARITVAASTGFSKRSTTEYCSGSAA